MDIILTPLMLSSIPIVLGVVSVFKIAGLADRWAPLASLIMGVGVAALIGGPLVVVVLGGLVIGLSASGLYSGTKTTAGR